MSTQTPTHESDIEFAPLGHASSSPGKSIDIINFTLSIWKPLALGIVAGGILGVLMYLRMGPVYEANTRILVSQRAAVADSPRETNLTGERSEHVDLIMSDDIVQRAMDKFGLRELPAFKTAYDPLMDVLDSLSAQRSAGRDSSFVNLIDLKYAHPDKDVAKKVIAAMVAAYDDYLEETRKTNSSELYEALTRREKDLQARIDELEQAYLQFRDESPWHASTPPIVTANGMVAAGQSPYQARVERIRQDRNENDIRKAEIQSRISVLQDMIDKGESRETLEFFVLQWFSSGSAATQGSGGAGLTEPPGKAQLDNRLLEAQLLLSRLMQHLADDHPSVLRLKEQIGSILSFYKRKGLAPPHVDDSLKAAPPAGQTEEGVDLVTSFMQLQKQKLVELDHRDKLLAKSLEEAEIEAKRASLFELEDQKRKDEIERVKDQLKTALTQLSTFAQYKDQEGYRLKQIAPIRVDRSRTRPIKIVGMFSMMGVMAVFVLLYYREWSDISIRTLADVRSLVQSPIFGAVPSFRPQLFRVPDTSRLGAELFYYHHPGSREAEAFRSIRTTLYASLDGTDDRLLQISSPEPGDGKSTTAANLAIAMAQSGKRVLLVDGDLRRPTLHKLFKLRSDIGLVDVLSGDVDAETAMQETAVEGLRVLVAGAPPANPAEALSSARLGRTLHELRGECDYIIVDTPPILAVSDPCIISPHCDGMLLVIRADKNQRPAVRRTQEILAAHGVRLHGVVVNALDAEKDEGYDVQSYAAYYAEETAPTPAAPAKTQSEPANVTV
ncbi:Tyrosine-protein kinase YwqD [Maioricimonas rarisocia]|uniref:non-specific protein-tyrosine kinase n=1 Tax=Maioricimonas rarisocia TaxID=2528026 RepID=A0A517Z7D3_9PLAN|nr:polysaccharide biosynthesis tyrosine autokinase [Maioricimonas rarisocia]QDU38388.1 Tyrosine-protein kinase YwqD [Maioricimonas rarisocia]